MTSLDQVSDWYWCSLLCALSESFAYFAVKLERQSKTAKIAKRDAKFRKENRFSFQTAPVSSD
jgi:hypothetical protein